MKMIFDNVVPEPLLRGLLATWPKENWRGWHHYSGVDSEKYGSRSREGLPRAVDTCLNYMCSGAIEKIISKTAFPDLELYGAGLHEIRTGGYLRRHRDSHYMESTGWIRMYSAVLFLNPRWEKEWGGAFELEEGEFVEETYPQWNRMVVFECNERAYHQVKDVVGPESRKTLSLFFWQDAGCSEGRSSAEFSS